MSVSTLANYTLGKTLGSGFSAKVKQGTMDDGSMNALKIFRLDNPNFNEKAFKLLREEVQATQNFDHKHVVKYFEFQENATMRKKSGEEVQVAFIAQEMVEGGELFDYVANSGPFSEVESRYFFKQMLQGVHYIHSKGFSHRDLKPENILLNKDYDVKIVDFGFACPLEGRDGSGTNKSTIGTPGYMAPEILLRQPYQGQVIDLFALGVILFILYSGHPPFQMANDQDNFYKLLATNRSDLFWKAHSNRKAADFYSDDFKDLITCMLQFHPHQRLCIADIIGHPWLANGATADPDTIRSEFARRENVNKQRAQEEEERKQTQRAQVNQAPRRDFQVGGKVYLSHGEEPTTESAAAATATVVHLALKEYEARQGRTHAFFSVFKPDYLLEQLTAKLTQNGQAFTMSDKTWKITMDVCNEISDPTEEGQAEMPVNQERCRMQVEITKVPCAEGETPKYCVDFTRKAGSAILFYDNANKYIDLLELCNNTTLEE